MPAVRLIDGTPPVVGGARWSPGSQLLYKCWGFGSHKSAEHRMVQFSRPY